MTAESAPKPSEQEIERARDVVKKGQAEVGWYLSTAASETLTQRLASLLAAVRAEATGAKAAAVIEAAVAIRQAITGRYNAGPGQMLAAHRAVSAAQQSLLAAVDAYLAEQAVPREEG